MPRKSNRLAIALLLIIIPITFAGIALMTFPIFAVSILMLLTGMTMLVMGRRYFNPAVGKKKGT